MIGKNILIDHSYWWWVELQTNFLPSSVWKKWHNNFIVISFLFSGLITQSIPLRIVGSTYFIWTLGNISPFINLPASIYLLKVNHRNTGKRCEICSKLTLKTPERRHWRHSGGVIINFEHISHLFLEFLLVAFSK